MTNTLRYAAVCMVLLGARGAVAQTVEVDSTEASTSVSTASGAELQQAQDHFRKGVLLYQEGNYNGALAEFTRAYQAVPNYRVLYNLAQTHAERHDYVKASQLFAEYLRQGGDDVAWSRREAVERERSLLRERVGTLGLGCNVDGAELFVNGESQGVIERRHSFQLNPGVSELRLEKAGYEPATRRITLVGGDQLALDLALQPSGIITSEAATSDVEERVTTPSRAGLWVSLAATAVLGGSAVTFAVLTLQTDRQLDRDLRAYPADANAIEDTRSRLRTYAAVTDAFTVGAALGTGALLYFLLSGPDSSASPVERRQDPASGGIDVHWLITGNGLALAGEF